MKKKIVAILSASLLVLTLTIELSAQSVLPFTDVTENNWYYNNLVELYSENIINGFEDGTFKGNSSLRLDQLLKLIITTLNPRGNYKKDPLDGWFAPYAKVCRDFRLLPQLEPKEGTYEDGSTYLYYDREDTSVYNVDIARSDVAIYVANAYNLCLIDEEMNIIDEQNKSADEFLRKTYKDYALIKDEAKAALFELYGLGIMKGDDSGNFNPNGNLTRAEATAIIYRLRKVKDRAVGLGLIDFDKLKNYGYVPSKSGNAETSSSNGTGIGIQEVHNDNTGIVITMEEVERIFASRESFIENFGLDYSGISDENIQELKEYYTQLAKNANK